MPSSFLSHPSFSLAAELNSHPKDADQLDNPLLKAHRVPPYSSIQPEHIVSAVKWLAGYVESEITKVEEHSGELTWESSFGRMEDILQVISTVTFPIGTLHSVDSKEERREAMEEFRKLMVPISLRISQSKKLYERLRQLTQSESYGEFSTAQKKALEDFLIGQEKSGIHLEGDKRKRFQELNQEMSALSLKFMNHSTDAIKAYHHIITDADELAGLTPDGFALLSSNYASETKKETSPEKGPWLIKCDQNSVGQVMKHCDNESLRAKIYRDSRMINSEGDHDNSDVIHQMLRLREETARLVGYSCFADMILTTRMASNKSKVLKMHQDFLAAIKTKLASEVELLTEFKRKLTGDKNAELQRSDLAYTIDQYIKKTFDYDSHTFRDYLPLEQVLTGLFDFLKEIFAITFDPITNEDPLWHKDVRSYQVRELTTGTMIAILRLDLYARPGQKRPGAWMSGYNPRIRNSKTGDLPVAHICCNFWPPDGDKPCLLDFQDLITLFHEFGHALQHMLTTVDVSSVAGTSGVEWDIVELPSQFMEYWGYNKQLLTSFARHYQTGEPLPDDLYQKMMDAKNFGMAIHYVRQIGLGLIDMELHSHFTPDKNAFTEYAKLLSEIAPFHNSELESKMLTTFGHIFAGGYAAGYYGYLWARIYSADAFSAFEEAGIDNSSQRNELGMRFKNTILALGGSEKPQDIYYKFRKSHEASPAALLRHAGLS